MRRSDDGVLNDQHAIRIDPSNTIPRNNLAQS